MSKIIRRKFCKPDHLKKKFYKKQLAMIKNDLVQMQYWVKAFGFRLIIIFEGRDAAGKGGIIKRLTEPLNPRGCRVVALNKPSDLQLTQWYFQRYVEHLPSAGEIVVFDRSWYNRAGVERVMGFCTESEVKEFFEACPMFERMLVRDGIMLLKYWVSISAEEQEARLLSRINSLTRRWKISQMDLESRKRWVKYSQARDDIFTNTFIPEAPWFVVEGDNKRRSRLNCLRHVLAQVPWKEASPPAIDLIPRPKNKPSQKVDPIDKQLFIPNAF